MSYLSVSVPYGEESEKEFVFLLNKKGVFSLFIDFFSVTMNGSLQRHFCRLPIEPYFGIGIRFSHSVSSYPLGMQRDT